MINNSNKKDMDCLTTAYYPSRGSIVKFRGKLYYFQPNGTACYLYRYESNIGRPERACHRPGRLNVLKPTDSEIAKFLPGSKTDPIVYPSKRLIGNVLILEPSSSRLTIPIDTYVFTE